MRTKFIKLKVGIFKAIKICNDCGYKGIRCYKGILYNKNGEVLKQNHSVSFGVIGQVAFQIRKEYLIAKYLLLFGS